MIEENYSKVDTYEKFTKARVRTLLKTIAGGSGTRIKMD